jgi:hypothetical protein
MLIQPRLQSLLVAGGHPCAGSASTLNLEDRLERQGLPAPASAVRGIGDPQEIEHPGDLDAASRKLDRLCASHQVPWAGRAGRLSDDRDPLPRRRGEVVPDPRESLGQKLLRELGRLSADLDGAGSAQHERPAVERAADLADDHGRSFDLAQDLKPPVLGDEVHAQVKTARPDGCLGLLQGGVPIVALSAGDRRLPASEPLGKLSLSTRTRYLPARRTATRPLPRTG